MPMSFYDFYWKKSRVVDPYSFFTDPDPELDVGGQYGSGSNSGSGSNTDPGLLLKNLELRNFFLFFFWSKTAIYLSLGLHKVYPSYRKSLQFSKEAIQHFKTWTFTNYCLLLWAIFALLDPDPDPDSEYGSGFTDPIEYGSNPDPDPQPWKNAYRILSFSNRDKSCRHMLA